MGRIVKSDFDPKAYVIDVVKRPFIREMGGISVEGILTLKSAWNYFNPAKKGQFLNGLLIQEGDVGIVNPDRNADISCFNIQLNYHIYFSGNEQSLYTGAGIIIAFPKDPAALNEKGEGDFFTQLSHSFPQGFFKQSEAVNVMNMYPTRSNFLPHCNFLQKQTGAANEIGLPLYKKLKDRKLKPDMLDAFKEAQAVSTNPAVRSAIFELMKNVFLRTPTADMFLPQPAATQALPREAPAPTPIDP